MDKSLEEGDAQATHKPEATNYCIAIVIVIVTSIYQDKMSSLPQPTYLRSVHSQPSSNGSFGPVFVVLSIIAVLAVIACVIGRFCTHKLSEPPKTHGKRAASNKDDVEAGYGTKVPVMKPTAHMMKQNKINPGSSELEGKAVNASYEGGP